MRVQVNDSGSSFFKRLSSPVTNNIWRLCDRGATWLQSGSINYGLRHVAEYAVDKISPSEINPAHDFIDLTSGLNYKNLENTCPTTSSFSKSLFVSGQSVRRITSVALKLANDLSCEDTGRGLPGSTNVQKFITEELKPALIEYAKSDFNNSQALETVLSSKIFCLKRDPKKIIDEYNEEIKYFNIQSTPVLKAAIMVATLNKQLLSPNYLALIPGGVRDNLYRNAQKNKSMSAEDYIDNLIPVLVVGTQHYLIDGYTSPVYFHVPLNEVTTCSGGYHNPMSLEVTVNLLELLRAQKHGDKKVEIYKKDKAFDNFVRICEGINQDYDPAIRYYYEVCATLIEELQHAQDRARCPLNETQTDDRFTDALTQEGSVLKDFHNKAPYSLKFTNRELQLIDKSDVDKIIKEFSGNIARIALIKDPRFGLKSIYTSCCSTEADVLHCVSHNIAAILWAGSIFPEEEQNILVTDFWREQSPTVRILEKFNKGEDVLLPLKTRLHSKELKFPIEQIASL